jgi:hypothetical protein
LHGYDFEDSDPNPLPTVESHGTHVSGIIAAEKNNGKGGMGVAQNARIMALKFGFDVASEVASIDFAIQNGAKVINASYGGPDFSQAEYDAIDRFRAAGGVFVAAAGNSGLNNDAPSQHNYPSDYNLPNIISVAATDAHDALASFSNYGSTSIDVGAPGVNILSSIADSVVSSETFQSLTAPAVPDGWTATGNWGTRAIAGSNVVLYGDAGHVPYAASANATITLPEMDLSGASGAQINFSSRCDTEYSTSPDAGGAC